MNTDVNPSGLDLFQMLDRIYPVGSEYINHSDDRDPSIILGFGQWELVPTIAFWATETTAQSVAASTFTKLIYGDVVYNHGDAYNPSNGTFYAPYTGIYSFSAGATRDNGFSGYYRLVLALWINGVNRLFLHDDRMGGESGLDFGLYGTAPSVFLNEGDYVFASLWQNTGGSQLFLNDQTEDSYFMGSYLGDSGNPTTFKWKRIA